MIQWTKLWSKFINRINLFGKWRHLYRIRKSKQIIHKIKEINKDRNAGGMVINYLRKINPFVFEEMILTIIENSNIRIYRNKRYTGDGGVDGIFKVSSGKVLIQCKRYKSYINAKDVKELSQKVNEGRYKLGIFVHTGKTGDKSKGIMKIENNIIFISGSSLVNLITGDLHMLNHIKHKL